jgi:hypothetical protein
LEGCDHTIEVVLSSATNSEGVSVPDGAEVDPPCRILFVSSRTVADGGRLTGGRAKDGRQGKRQSCQRGYHQKWSRCAIQRSQSRLRYWSCRLMSPKRTDHRSCRWSHCWRSWHSRQLPIGRQSRRKVSSCWRGGKKPSREEQGYRRQCMQRSRQLGISLVTMMIDINIPQEYASANPPTTIIPP